MGTEFGGFSDPAKEGNPTCFWKLSYLFLCFGCLTLYFPAGFKRLYLPDRSKGRCCPFPRCFELLSECRKGRHPHRWTGQRARAGDVPMLAERSRQPERSLGENSLCST